jgi:hypothetical protein
MATVLEGVLPKSSILLRAYYGQEDSMQRIFIKKCFLLTVGSVCRVKRFYLGGKRFADDEEFFFLIRIVGGGVQAGSTRHVGH